MQYACGYTGVQDRNRTRRSSNMKLLILLSLMGVVCVETIDLNINDKHNTALGACQACKTVVKSFKAAMEKTARGYHEGGDADWESKKLKNYANSEVRLAEIQSLLCSDIVVGKSQCHHVANEAEEALESEWWPAEPRPDLHAWLCVERRRDCCPDGHFGADCRPCPGGADAPCSGHGHCKGAGTRKGNGVCVCHKGYAGTVCSSCNLTDHYEAYKDEKKLVCSPCHKSCSGACTGAGPKHCVRCAAGYEWQAELGCSDVNECLRPDVCRANQLCINDPGTHTCLDCDKACATCHGDGPDMCHECAEGYVKKGKHCVDEAEFGGSNDSEEEEEQQQSSKEDPEEEEPTPDVEAEHQPSEGLPELAADETRQEDAARHGEL